MSKLFTIFGLMLALSAPSFAHGDESGSEETGTEAHEGHEGHDSHQGGKKKANAHMGEGKGKKDEAKKKAVAKYKKTPPALAKKLHKGGKEAPAHTESTEEEGAAHE